MRSHLDEADFADGEEVFVAMFAQLRRAAVAAIRATATDRPVHEPAALAADGAEIVDPAAVITEADWLALFEAAGADVIGDVVVDSAAGVGITYGFDVADPAVQQVAAEQIAGLEQWGSALRHQVTRWVEDGLRQGWGVDEMVANLPTNSPLSDTRARTIARTEMNAAANMGVLAGWEMAGIEGKMWLTAHDARVRPDHVEMDKVVVAFTEDFLVGGHPARAPGDPRLPPSERVNCRCTLIAVEADQLRENAATTRHELAAKNEQLGLPTSGASKAQLQRQALSRACATSPRRALTAAASAAASACPATVESLSRTELLIHAKELRISGRHAMSTDDLRQQIATARLAGIDDVSREAGGFAPIGRWKDAIAKAKAKAHGVPQPSDADVEKGLEEAELARAGLSNRAGGDRRGSAEARRRRAAAMFNEFDGQQNGYVPCVYCGRKVHFADAARHPDLNPLGYPKFEQDKLLDGMQGGTYRIANLVPACVPCNRARSNMFHGFGKPAWGDPVKNTARIAKAVGKRYTPGGVAGASTIGVWPATRSVTGRRTSRSSPASTWPRTPSVPTEATPTEPSGLLTLKTSPPANWSATSPSSTSPSVAATTTPSASVESPSTLPPCAPPDGWATHSHGKRRAKGGRPGKGSDAGGGAGGGGGDGGAGKAADVAGGKAVTVEPGEVAGVVDHMADAPGPVDLTLVTVAGHPNMFSEMRGSGIPRSAMPQIPREHLVGFQADLASRGVKTTPGRRNARDLKATQSELNGQAVGQLQRDVQSGSFDLESKPTWVSNDGHVLDGHHRWAAAATLNRSLPVIEVDMPMSKLLDVAQQFTSAQGIERRKISAAVAPAGPGMATDAEDGIDDADLADLAHGDGTAFVESAGQASSWVTAFVTHSHGKRKAKGRKPGTEGGDPSFHPKGGGGGGGGGGGDATGGGGGDAAPTGDTPSATDAAAGRSFQNAAEGRAWAGDEFADWQKSVSPDERAALKRYTQDGSVLMNEPLRGKRPVDAITRRHAVPAVKAANRHQLSEPIDAVRGAHFDDATLAKMTPGATFVDKGFTSTTLNARPPRTINANTVFTVKMPKGTRGAYVTPFATGNVKGEAEFTLPPGSTFRIGSVTKKGGKTNVTMELIAQESEASVLKRLGA